MRSITNETLVEDLVRAWPDAVSFFMQRGVKCIACGEPIWGSIGDLCRSTGMTDERAAEVLAEATTMMKGKK